MVYITDWLLVACDKLILQDQSLFPYNVYAVFNAMADTTLYWLISNQVKHGPA